MVRLMMMISRSVVAARALGRRRELVSPLASSWCPFSSYTDDQEKKGRPLSPHVDVYAFPPSAISSITIRITGVALALGAYGMAGAALSGCDVAECAAVLGSSGSLLSPVAKIGVSFPLTYHYLGAVRHAVWDLYPDTVTNEVAQQSTYGMFGLSGLVAFGSLLV